MQLNLFKKTKNEKRKYRRQKIYTPLPEQVQKMLYVKRLYDELGTLQKVADHLKITRERVRQQLNKGERYQLFQYKPTRERKLGELIQSISREELIEEIKNGKNRFDICSKFNIGMDGYFKLLKFYQIDTIDYRIEALQKKYLIKYSNIVDELGHHPSTTEMQHAKKSWRYTGLAIARIWGSIDRFRREYGIAKPPHYIHPNTKLVWQKSKNKSRERIENIKEIIATQGPISLKDMASALRYNESTTHSYLYKLFKGRVIKRTNSGKGGACKYFI